MTNDEREKTRESIVQFAKEAGGYLPPPAPKAQTEAREVLQEMFIDQVSSYYLAGRDLVKPLAESMAESIAVDERGYWHTPVPIAAIVTGHFQRGGDYEGYLARNVQRGVKVSPVWMDEIKPGADMERIRAEVWRMSSFWLQRSGIRPS